LFIFLYLYFLVHLMIYEQLRLCDVTRHDDYAQQTNSSCSVVLFVNG